MVELEVYTNELFYGLSGDWSLNLLVDKTAPDGESLVVEPGQRITLDGRWWTVSKAVVAPSGRWTGAHRRGRLSAGELFHPGTIRAIICIQKYYGMVSRPILPVSNFVAFYGGRAGHGVHHSGAL